MATGLVARVALLTIGFRARFNSVLRGAFVADRRQAKSPYTEDRLIPGSFEGETVTRRRFMVGGIRARSIGQRRFARIRFHSFRIAHKALSQHERTSIYIVYLQNSFKFFRK